MKELKQERGQLLCKNTRLFRELQEVRRVQGHDAWLDPRYRAIDDELDKVGERIDEIDKQRRHSWVNTALDRIMEGKR